jgi:hypothetical protein
LIKGGALEPFSLPLLCGLSLMLGLLAIGAFLKRIFTGKSRESI